MRCAIYTRKSSEEGLAQEFNSLDAQRESAEAYILSQRHAGWTALTERYDDGGYTGANALCETACSTATAHMCTTEEVLRSAMLGLTLGR